MKKYNLKNDLKRISYTSFSILILLFIFIVFSFAILLPIFLVSKYYPTTYTIIALSLILILFIFLVTRKLVSTWNKYKNLGNFSLHLLIYLLIPVIGVIFITIIETFFFRVFYDILSFPIATVMIVILNIVLIISIIFLRRFFFNIKQYLRENQLK